ncbi:MAG: hypothetical protein K8H90_00915 [Thermoanaerobaculia bacterium]|nr:hypothetical protein [Thermoanaerobaculia bacterium]
MREKLTLFSNGYVYHPRFLFYHLEVGGALKQEQFEATYLPSRRRSDDSGLEYDARVVLLPEHPYNLELFALRYEPLLKEQWVSRRATVNTSHGVDFRYRDKPWFFHSRYNQDRLENGESTYDVSKLAFDGQYFKNFDDGRVFSVDAQYTPSWFDSSYGLEGSTTEARVGNLIEWRRYRLSSNVSRAEYEQEAGGTGRLESEQFSWHEQFSADLPFHLRTEASWRYLDSTSRQPSGVAGGRREYDSENRDFDLDLIHQLYRSLESTYTFRHTRNESTGGESTAFGHALNFNYTKEIPLGRLIANLGGSRFDSETAGRVDVVEEGHPATPVPGSFLLARQNVESGSLRVTLRSPEPPNEMVELAEGAHYSVVAVGAGLEVTIFALPPRFVVPAAYEIRVHYSLAGGRYELRTESLSHGASVELFDHLLTPYYSYTELHSRVLSGRYVGGGLDSTTLIGGLRFQWRMLRARAEYQRVEWETSPYESWLGEVQLVGTLGPTTSVFASVSHRDRRYPEGRPGALAGEYHEKTSTAAASASKQLFSRRLVVSLGGSYSRLDGLVDNEAFSANASAAWKIGRLDLAVGASVFDTDTEGPFVVASRRTHEYYYLKLRRLLF